MEIPEFDFHWDIPKIVPSVYVNKFDLELFMWNRIRKLLGRIRKVVYP
jgi:hypothetical protein